MWFWETNASDEFDKSSAHFSTLRFFDSIGSMDTGNHLSPGNSSLSFHNNLLCGFAPSLSHFSVCFVISLHHWISSGLSSVLLLLHPHCPFPSLMCIFSGTDDRHHLLQPDFGSLGMLTSGSGGVPIVVGRKWIWLGTVRLRIWSLASLSGLRIQCCCAVSCGVGCRYGLDLALLCLWPAAVAPIGPLAWEPPGAAIVALKSKKEKEKKKRFRSSCCVAIGLVASLELWDAGLIHSLDLYLRMLPSRSSVAREGQRPLLPFLGSIFSLADDQQHQIWSLLCFSRWQRTETIRRYPWRNLIKTDNSQNPVWALKGQVSPAYLEELRTCD